MLVADELDAEWTASGSSPPPRTPGLRQPGRRPAILRREPRRARPLEPLRKAGAAARMMLRQAAAQEWGVPLDEVTTEPGAVVHVPRAGGSCTANWSTRRRRCRCRRIRRSRARTSSVTSARIGRASTPPEGERPGRVYGIDVKLPGMLVASIERCPVVAGGKVKSFDATAAKAVPGVRHVVQGPSGVAVVADGFWIAVQGRKALKVEWDEGPLAPAHERGISKEHATAAGQPGLVARNEGDAAAALAAGGKTFEAVYEVPYLEHACMEPMNATAHVPADAVHGVGADPDPGRLARGRRQADRAAGEQVTVHTTFLGGGFGRRVETDYVADAVEVAKAIGGGPVKVDLDARGRHPRTTSTGRAPTTCFRAALDGRRASRPPGSRAWSAPGSSASGAWPLPARWTTRRWRRSRTCPTTSRTRGRVGQRAELGIPIGFWRSVGLAERVHRRELHRRVAHAAGKDPFEYRRALLGKSPRHKGVLELAAKGGLGPAAAGGPRPRDRGVLLVRRATSPHVAEVSVAATAR